MKFSSLVWVTDTSAETPSPLMVMVASRLSSPSASLHDSTVTVTAPVPDPVEGDTVAQVSLETTDQLPVLVTVTSELPPSEVKLRFSVLTVNVTSVSLLLHEVKTPVANTDATNTTNNFFVDIKRYDLMDIVHRYVKSAYIQGQPLSAYHETVVGRMHMFRQLGTEVAVARQHVRNVRDIGLFRSHPFKEIETLFQ